MDKKDIETIEPEDLVINSEEELQEAKVIAGVHNDDEKRIKGSIEKAKEWEDSKIISEREKELEEILKRKAKSALDRGDWNEAERIISQLTQKDIEEEEQIENEPEEVEALLSKIFDDAFEKFKETDDAMIFSDLEDHLGAIFIEKRHKVNIPELSSKIIESFSSHGFTEASRDALMTLVSKLHLSYTEKEKVVILFHNLDTLSQSEKDFLRKLSRNTNFLKQYFAPETFKPLTLEEKIKIYEQVGNITEIPNEDIPLLTQEEVIILMKKMREEEDHIESERAKKFLIIGNLKLVRYMSNKMKEKLDRIEYLPEFDKDDLFQTGVMGLIKALEKYDLEKGFRFSTYAFPSINAHLKSLVTEYWFEWGRIPQDAVTKARQIFDKKDELLFEHGREPTIAEIAKETNLSEKKVDEILNNSAFLKLESLEDLLDLYEKLSLYDEDNIESLDSDMEEYKYTNAFNKISGPSIDNIIDDVSKELLKDNLVSVLETLTPREQKVLELRFGLDSTGRSKDLEEVGKFFGVTRERVRQIEAKALRKLRHPMRSKRLKDYLS